MSFWKKSVFLTLGQFTRGQGEGRSTSQKIHKFSFLLQLNCIDMSYDGVIIINRRAWVRKMFFVCVTFPRNEKKVIWCLNKSPCRFRQKALLEGWSWNESCPKGLLKAHVLHFHFQMSIYALLVREVYIQNDIQAWTNLAIP